MWAAFSPDGGAAPFKEATARRCLDELLTFVCSPAYAAEHAWHDFRATVCSALIGAKTTPAGVTLSPEVAQAMLCWASPASVALYDQLSAADMADAAETAATTDAARHAHLPRPHIDAESVSAELGRCVDALTSATAVKRRAVKRAAASPRTAGGSRRRKAAPPPSDGSRKRKAAAPPPDAAEAAAANDAARHAHLPRPHIDADHVSTALSIFSKRVDVGPPLGTVDVDVSHSLSGERVYVANSVWSSTARGSTWCSVVGLAPCARLGDSSAVYVVCGDDDGMHYSLTSSVLRSYLFKRLRAKV